MSAYNPAYNPAGYLTDVYGQLVPENPYAPFYPGPPTDQYVPCHWTPDPNQAFYAPSISQGIPPGWHCPPAFSADGNNPHMYLGGYSAVPLNPAYLPSAHYYAYLVPATAPTPPGPMDNYSPLVCHSPPKPLLLPGSKGCTHTLLTNLGYPDTSATPEVWADRLLNFHKCYLQGNLLETTQGTLGIDNNLRNKLHALVEEIHTSPNPHPFKDPLDPTHSFHVQCGEPIRTQSKAPPSIPRQQEELNVASSILRNLNSMGELFDQPAAHILALSACPRANSVPSAFRTWDQPAVSKPCPQQPPPRVDDDNWTLSYIDEPDNPADEHAPCNRPPRDQPPHFDLRAPRVNAPPPIPTPRSPCDSPQVPGRPDHPFLPTILIPRPLRCLTLPPTQIILDPPGVGDPLDGPQGPPRATWVNPPAEGHPMADPLGDGAWQWTTSPPQRRNGNNYYYYYNARPPPRAQNPQDNTRDTLARESKLNIQKPETFTGHDSRKWQIFLTQCLTMFQAKPITFQLESSQVAFAMSYLQGIAFNHYTALLRFNPNNPVLSNWLAFTQEFSSKFGIFDTVAEAEENLFNLQMRNNECFMTFIDVLCLAPKQTTYNRYKALVTQVDQHYWEDRSKNMAPRTPWNASGNTNWQARATNSVQSSIPANPANPVPCFPLGQGITSTNPPQGQRPLAQLNAANLHETPEPLDTNPDDHDDIPDPANDQEALCANRIQDSPWINVLEEMQEK
ncbi:hypothetical protein E4T56_gene16599 [Termitomyces sp. T112]|nr:hypothetical protein E4T56_gene16599 [Termitomyces sp. T112]